MKSLASEVALPFTRVLSACADSRVVAGNPVALMVLQAGERFLFRPIGPRWPASTGSETTNRQLTG